MIASVTDAADLGVRDAGAALSSGVGRRNGLPVSVSLIGQPGGDWDLLAGGAALQDELGTVSP